jgi:hypothetical protein
MLTDGVSGTRACRVSQTVGESLSVNVIRYHSVPSSRSARFCLFHAQNKTRAVAGDLHGRPHRLGVPIVNTFAHSTLPDTRLEPEGD